jgi:hypothetical protein
MSFKVQNWPEYEAGLRRRGSLTLWLDDGARRHWQTLGPGGQARCHVRFQGFQMKSGAVESATDRQWPP